MGITIGGSAGHVNYAEQHSSSTQHIDESSFAHILKKVPTVMSNQDDQEKVLSLLHDIKHELNQESPDTSHIQEVLSGIAAMCPPIYSTVITTFSHALNALGIRI